MTALDDEVTAAEEALAKASARAHTARCRAALVAAGMPVERATPDLAASLLPLTVGDESTAIDAAVATAKQANPGLFTERGTTSTPVAAATAGDGSSGLRALEEFGYRKKPR